jgi:alkylation response protein AidB-like acyl-CoA dehydrogenase
MADFRAPVEDSRFALRHFGMIDRIAATERFAHADPEMVDTLFEEVGRFFAEVFGPTDRIGDIEGLTWTPEGVGTPEAFKPAWAKFVEAGWQGMVHSPDYGGAGLPGVVVGLATEYASSANTAFTMLPGLTTGAIELLERWGSEEQKETYLPKMVAGEWAGTMNLTEPQAGSDVGLATTRAVPQADGSYRITGTKIFISFGDQDLTENIVHLVLARIPGAPAGTKGISLFLVPKFLVREDGSLGERNDVSCVSLEHKMGIHASPTCVMSFGDGDGAIGWLVGEENQGMRAMFTMMNNARLAVGNQAVGLAEAAFQKAVSYSLERLQGREVGGEGTGPAPIVRHPDVRRMLLSMRSRVEVMRNLVTHAAGCLDMAHATEGEEAERWQEIVDLLMPVTKAWTTDLAMEVVSTAVQVHGGMGFIEESGVAQHYRDVRIFPIYEGTNGIQGMDLVGRKLGMRMGGAMADHMARVRDVLPALADTDGLGAMHETLSAAADELQKCTEWVMGNGLADPRDALAGATPYLELMGLVTGGWLMARQALVATAELDRGDHEPDGAEAAFLRAKVTTARFFCEQVLPKAFGLAPAITAGHDILFEIGDDGFGPA